MYSSTLSLTSALEGSGWLAPRPDRFTPGKESLYLLYRRLGGPQDRSGRVWKISPPPELTPGRSNSELLYRLRYPGPDIGRYVCQHLHAARDNYEVNQFIVSLIFALETCIKKQLMFS